MSECKSKKCCKSEQGTVMVQRIFQNGKIVMETDETVEKIQLPLMEGLPMATVSADRSVTKGMPGYNSLKVGAFVSVSCYLEEQEIQNAISYCEKTAEARLEKACDEFYAFLVSKYPDIFKAAK